MVDARLERKWKEWKKSKGEKWFMKERLGKGNKKERKKKDKNAVKTNGKDILEREREREREYKGRDDDKVRKKEWKKEHN